MKGITFGQCVCGKRFRSYSAEAVHRHNFPALCRQSRKAKRKVKEAVEFREKLKGESNAPT
jgi:hypothetical protein